MTVAAGRKDVWMGWDEMRWSKPGRSRDWNLDHMMQNIGLVPKDAPKHASQSVAIYPRRISTDVSRQTKAYRDRTVLGSLEPIKSTVSLRAFLLPVLKVFTRGPLAKRSCARCRAPEGI